MSSTRSRATSASAPRRSRRGSRATPGAAERRAALVAARELLAQVPGLDELAAARFRSAALLEADRTSARTARRRSPARRSGARGRRNRGRGRRDRRARGLGRRAHRAVELQGVERRRRGAVQRAGDDGRALDQDRGRSVPSPTSGHWPAPAVARGRALGDSTSQLSAPDQPDELAPAANGTTTNASRPASDSGQDARRCLRRRVDHGPPEQPGSGDRDAAAPPATSTACRRRRLVPVSGPLVLRATATLHGVPVVVLVYVAEQRSTSWSSRTPSCALLERANAALSRRTFVDAAGPIAGPAMYASGPGTSQGRE